MGIAGAGQVPRTRASASVGTLPLADEERVTQSLASALGNRRGGLARFFAGAAHSGGVEFERVLMNSAEALARRIMHPAVLATAAEMRATAQMGDAQFTNVIVGGMRSLMASVQAAMPWVGTGLGLGRDQDWHVLEMPTGKLLRRLSYFTQPGGTRLPGVRTDAFDLLQFMINQPHYGLALFRMGLFDLRAPPPGFGSLGGGGGGGGGDGGGDDADGAGGGDRGDGGGGGGSGSVMVAA